ncbi:lipase family protein [Saccharopolyspora rosea]|uniref:Lipase family protein n=1 Tax=Saccharopolyspora rosea TaxID=524884 RepID=A0ABW3FS95_9PSEU
MHLSGRPARVFAVAVAVAAAVLPSTASAAPTSFYDPPTPLPPGSDGDIIRHEPTEFFLDPARTLRAPADAQRIMYRSTDTHGRPMAVTGTVLTPRTPWRGTGERPIVGYAVGTQGVGDDCAPSKALAAGNEYEGPFISGLLARGYGVVVTDYEGLGTPGVHTYVNRVSEGHAVLDSIRAAQRLDAAGLPDHGPVAITGYSQGGGASASAAELQRSYAPELDLKGAYAGAPPADLTATARALDGTYGAGLVGFALAGMNAAYPDLDIPRVLNDRGKRLLDEISDECVTDIPKYAFMRSADLTRDGRPLEDYLAEEPFHSRIAEQTIGLRAPHAPVLVAHSRFDDLVPFDQGRRMAESWCQEGATVQFSAYPSPTHVATALAAFPEAYGFLQNRFADQAPPDNCGKF